MTQPPVKVTVNRDGTYILEGKRHCLDGPAVVFPDGTKMWYLNNKRHRVDGPAIEWADGRKEYFIEGKRYDLFDILKDVVNNYSSNNPPDGGNR